MEGDWRDALHRAVEPVGQGFDPAVTASQNHPWSEPGGRDS